MNKERLKFNIMKRLFFRLFWPKIIRVLDYAASYPSQWIDGGVPIETLRKKFGEAYLDQLIDKGYLVIENESIGIDNLKREVYSLTPEAHKIARSKSVVNSKKKECEMFWMSVAKGVVITVIGALILAIIYIVVKAFTGVELPL